MLILRLLTSTIFVLHIDGAERRLSLCESREGEENEARVNAVHMGLGQRVLLDLSHLPHFPTDAHCSLRISTCPSCVIGVHFLSPYHFFSNYEANTYSRCDKTNPKESCLNVEIIEEKAAILVEPVDPIYSRRSIWASSPTSSNFNSTSSQTIVTVSLWSANSKLLNYVGVLFPITVTIYDNSELIEGGTTESLSSGFIQSPRYPSAYPRSTVKNYTLLNKAPNGYVRLVFDDFYLHFQSELRILDSDGEELVNTRRDHRRPPAILSKGDRLSVLFSSRDFTQIVGFRAHYEFVDESAWPDKPNTQDCDEYLESPGGVITLENAQNLASSFVDCIWLVGRFPVLSRTFDRVYLKVNNFAVPGIGMRLEVRQGPNSAGDRLLLLVDSQSDVQLWRKQPSDGFITNLTMPAFYVRLRGFLISNTGMQIAYSQFYRWTAAHCPGSGEFHCDNGRCIKSSLMCDKIDHCGDRSEEICTDDSSPPDTESDVTGLIVLVVGSCGVVVLLIAATALFARLYRKRLVVRLRREQMRLERESSFGAEPGPSIQTVGGRRFYVVPSNELSVVEAPPAYNDALKHPFVPDEYAQSPAYLNAAFSPSFTVIIPQVRVPSRGASSPSCAEEGSRTFRDGEATEASPSRTDGSLTRPSSQSISLHSESWV